MLMERWDTAEEKLSSYAVTSSALMSLMSWIFTMYMSQKLKRIPTTCRTSKSAVNVGSRALTALTYLVT